ncbi:hypothetical protein C8Q78DRAFT_419306 [Trametes maxima]|nr:hypothetical protein C8Q78DRAFT_419306 [Trametes maxima]
MCPTHRPAHSYACWGAISSVQVTLEALDVLPHPTLSMLFGALDGCARALPMARRAPRGRANTTRPVPQGCLEALMLGASRWRDGTPPGQSCGPLELALMMVVTQASSYSSGAPGEWEGKFPHSKGTGVPYGSWVRGAVGRVPSRKTATDYPVIPHSRSTLWRRTRQWAVSLQPVRDTACSRVTWCSATTPASDARSDHGSCRPKSPLRRW